jgi:hypothetical protein
LRTLNSLIPAKNSLFFEIFSLLIEIAKFPVKLPVIREFAWRRLRSALCRQPGSAVFENFLSSMRKARQVRAFSSPVVSGDRRSNFLGRKFPKVSSRIQENSRFLETRPGGRGINALRDRRGSALSSQCLSQHASNLLPVTRAYETDLT